MDASPASNIPSKALRVAVIQNNAGTVQADNLSALDRLIARSAPADVIALPEVFAARGSDDDLRRSAAAIPSELTVWLAELASSKGCWVLAGSVLERRGGAIYNTCLVFDGRGAIRARYRKIHLFEAHFDDGRVIKERAVYEPGSRPALVNIEGWLCGLAICYDLRFPELFRLYADRGAHLFFVPANFNRGTGKAHWDVLTRARAIENQAFVVAPNQCGMIPGINVPSFGHSMVVAPWGNILARATNSATCLNITLEPALLREARKRIPALQHRRIRMVIRR